MPATVERLFTGWDTPALRAAAELLIARYLEPAEVRLDRAVVVLPGARAGRRLIELLVDRCAEHSLRLAPPRVTTVRWLPELFYAPAAPAPDAVTAARAWAAALRALPPERLRLVAPHPPAADDLVAWDVLARAIARLHQEVAGAALRFDDVADACAAGGLLHDDRHRWLALAHAQRDYVARLAALRLADPELARLEATSGNLACDRDLWLVGAADLPAIARRILAAAEARVTAVVHAPPERAADFDELGCARPDAWARAAVPLDDDRLRVARDPAAQAAAAVAFLRELDGALAADEITIGVPDPEVVPYLERALAAAGVPARPAAGTPASRSAPFRLLDAAGAVLAGRRWDDVAALLRHPDLAAGDDLVPGADAYHARHLPATLGAGMPVGSDGERAWLAALRALLEGDEGDGGVDGGLLPRDAHRGRRRSAEWADVVLDTVARAYGHRTLRRSVPDERALLAALDALRAAAAAVAAVPRELDATCDFATGLRLTLAAAAGAELPREADRAAVELLGWLELHLDDAPALLITGFNEPFLPEAATADAFLPNALRTRLGLLDNERRRARDAYQLTAILHSRPYVRFVAGRWTATGDPHRPSRLMLATAGPALAERVLRFYGDGAERATPAAHPPSPAAIALGGNGFRLPPERVLRAPEPLTSLRVTDFRALLQDPYLFALQRVLRLEPMDDAARELDPRVFGTVAHDVLERFGRSPAADAADPAAVRAALDGLLDDEARRRFGAAALPAVRVQLEQLRARLHAFADRQAERVADGWQIIGVELDVPHPGVPFVVDGTPFHLRGRVDRVDYHAGRDEYAILDYKTSDRADPPEKTHRRGRGASKEWVDLQLPLYRHLAPALRDADGEALIPSGASGGLQLGYVMLCRDLDHVAFVLAGWDDDLLAEADARAADVVRFVRRNAFAFDDERSGAGLPAGDPLAALMGRGQLGAGGEEEEDDDAPGG
jgi:ATP-dependent helicase/nuclease subunit B